MLIFILLFGQTMLQAETLVGPTIEVWYGDTQSFGNNGEPQVWCNILGNVSDSDGSVTGLEYTLNGGSPVTLSIGGDGRRLLSSGDFNVDLAVSDLLSGANSVVITATDNDGNMTMKTVTVNYTPGNVWPNPYSIDWSTLGGDETLINDVAHVVDGEFELTPDGIRTTSPGYDRLIGIGNKTWDNYEVLVPVTIHSMPGGAGVGVLLRWTGHTDTPVTCAQPKCGYLPLGDIAWYRPGALEFYEGSSTSRSLSIGTTYLFRAQVDSDGSGNTYYKLRVWEQGTAEPATWDLEDTVGPSDKQNGCLLLISHMADVTFGNVTITPGSLSLNNPQVQLSNGNTEATITWTTNQPTDSRIDYGPSCSFEDGFVEDATMTTSHSLNLTGLSPNTIYRYELTSENTGGEVTSGCLTFSTFTAGIVSDDFCEATLNPVWTFDDPLADGSYQLTSSGGTDSWLEISVPAGTEHQIYTSGIQAPNLLQPVNNADFEVEVKFESPVVTPEYQEQGILVKESANKYLRFEFFSKSPGNTHIYAQGFDLPTASSAFVNTDIAPSNTYPLYMRVKRTGTTWEQSYSFDGTTWMTAATFVYDLTPTMIGPYAGNALNSGSPAHTAQIDYFENLADPLEYEDNCSSMLPPVLAAIGNQILDEGNSLMIGLSATDPDGSDANLVFSESGLPAFATLVDNNDGTASLNINPLLGDAGTYPVTITVTDEDNLTDTESFDIVVNSPAPPSGLVSDDFCRHYLEEDYWTFVDPQADGSYGFTGFYTSDAWLEISVPSGSAHELWVNGIQAPHIIQAANDVDLDVTVKFESPLNAPQYQEQGMLFKQDDY
ncbi:MAG: fibronectin type III domain-containing protein, partial [Phaeodactylibacter sp.]|nr:fibronectin type III domain-containing protein [Phaeodactylibacter sp.]